MKIITVATSKGGTGKTTTAAALAQYAAKEGKRVLCIDLDPQGNLSEVLGADRAKPGAYEMITGRGYEIQSIGGIDVIASCPDLSQLKTAPRSGRRLMEALEPVKKRYFLSLIDTPPTLGELTFNALQAADILLIPLEADLNSLNGLYQIQDIAEEINNPRLKVFGTVITRYDGRPKINRHIKGIIEEETDLLGVVRQAAAVREAQSLKRNLFEYAPRSNAAHDYEELYKKLIRR